MATVTNACIVVLAVLPANFHGAISAGRFSPFESKVNPNIAVLEAD
jgi:hypothetical protein